MTRKPKRALRIAIVVACLAAGAFGVRASLMQLHASATAPVATARVTRGDFDVKIFTTGELRPVRSSLLIAPPVNGTLQIVRLWDPAVPVKPGAVIVEFDTTEQEFKLEEARSEFEQAEQEIAKSNADAAVQTSQDKLALLKARFDVRRAELEVGRNELVSSIDAQKNNLALKEAKRRLAQLEQDVKSREVSNRASLAVLEEKRNKSRLDIAQAEHAISTMKLKAPFGGVVSIKANEEALGGFFMPGVTVPDYREGDVVHPGRPVAEVLDGNMELQAKVTETDRSDIAAGEGVDVQVDAMPGKHFAGKVKTIASLTSRGRWWDSSSQHKFDAAFEIKGAEGGLRAGETAHVVISGSKLKGVLTLPAQAVFQKDGKPVVYAKSGSQFTARDVKVVERTEGRVVVDGIPEGLEVALANPESSPKQQANATADVVVGGAGR